MVSFFKRSVVEWSNHQVPENFLWLDGFDTCTEYSRLRWQILHGPLDVMLLQCLRGWCAIGVEARQLVIVVNSGINFLMRQSEARRGAGSLQRFEELLWQFVIFSSESFAGIERAEQTQPAATYVHQFIQSQIPACHCVHHFNGVLAIVQRPSGTINELAQLRRVEHGIEDFGLIGKADFLFAK